MGLGLALIVGLAAALRLPMLGEQSLWFDEAATATDVSGSFTDMVESVNDLEGSPHFFFFATWLGVQLMGTGEVALRLLSALAGVAVVPVLFATVRRLGGARAGLVAALLAATAPLLVWFSQEARAYQLVVLLAALTAYCAVRFRDTGEGRAYAGAVVFAVLGIATHYFATLTVVPLVAGMVVSRPSPAGALRWAPAAVPVAGLLLLPLVLHQSDTAKGAAAGDLGTRVLQIPKQLAVGYYSAFDTVSAVVVIGLAVGALGLALLRADARLRGQLLACFGLAAGAILPILALSAVGLDYLNTRNVIAALIPLCAALGLALAGDRAGLAVAGVLALSGTVTAISVGADGSAQRDDWRGAIQALGPSEGTRAIVTGQQSTLPFDYYLPGSRPATAPDATVSEIGVVGLARRGTGDKPEPPPPRRQALPPGFAPVGLERTELYTVQRFRAPRPVAVPLTTLSAMALQPGESQVYIDG